MMMRNLMIATFGILFVAAPFALAHPTGHESRTVADCEKLPGTATSGERGGCLACVQRPKPHHFHPDMTAGDRCHPDNGKAR